MLGAPIPHKTPIMYIVVEEKSLGTLCVQENGEGKEFTLYYLSRTLIGAELTYSPIRKDLLVAYLFHSETQTLHAGLCSANGAQNRSHQVHHYRKVRSYRRKLFIAKFYFFVAE